MDPTPLFLTRSLIQHRKGIPTTGYKPKPNDYYMPNSPAPYRHDHEIPQQISLIYSTVCERPNFENVFEVQLLQKKLLFSTDL